MGGRHIARTWLVVALVAVATSGHVRAQATGGEMAPAAHDARAARAWRVTASWYLLKYRQHPEKREARRPPSVAAKLDVVLWVQPQSGDVTIAGWF